MVIRRMAIEDYAAAYELWTSEEGVGLRSLDDSREGIGKFLGRNPDTCFVALIDGVIAGTILCGNDGRRGYIYHALVKEEQRGGGIGSALVDKVVEALKKIGIYKAALVVYADNEKGNEFWERKGFCARDDLVYRDLSLNDMNE